MATHADALRIVPAAAGDALTKDQKRFNTLLGQIAKARDSLKAWQEGIAQYGQGHVQLVLPLQTGLGTARRQWVLALHALSGLRSWTRAERETIAELVCEASAGLLQADPDDAELKAIFAAHADADFDDERQDQLRMLKDLTESMTGLDLGDEADIASEEDLLQRVQQGMQQQEAEADARREAKASRRRKTAAQQRRDDEAQQATRSVREVWRKLASALHPDRETDPAQRAAKTALMQEVNQAYEKSDLLALLELQLRIEQVDAAHMARADTQRVKHYNKVLAEQLGELRLELDRVEMAFRLDFGFEPGWGLDPRKLGALLQQQVRQLKGEQAMLRQQMGVFDDKAATKRWLRVQRQVLRNAEGWMGY